MRNPISSAATLAVLLVLSIAAPAGAQETGALPPPAEKAPESAVVAVPGTHVSLAPPAGFSKAARFSGFENAEYQASIMVTEVPGPYAEVARGFQNDAALASRGMKALGREAAKIGEREALVLYIAQSARGTAYEKVMLVTSYEGGTCIVTATYRAADRDVLKEPLDEAVRGVQVGAGKHAEKPLCELGKSEALKPSIALGGSSIGYTKGGAPTPRPPEEPILIVSRSLVPVATDDFEAEARTRLQKTVMVKDVRLSPSKPLELDGLVGYSITATATKMTKGKDDIEVFLRQVMLFEEDGGYWLIQCRVASSERERWEPEFGRMIDGFRRAR